MLFELKVNNKYLLENSLVFVGLKSDEYSIDFFNLCKSVINDFYGKYYFRYQTSFVFIIFPNFLWL